MVDSSDLLQLDLWLGPLKPRWKLLLSRLILPSLFLPFPAKRSPQKWKLKTSRILNAVPSSLDENFSSLKIDPSLSVSFFSGQKIPPKDESWKPNSPSMYDDLLSKEKSKTLSILPSKVGDSSSHQKMHDEWSKMNVQWWSSDLLVLRTLEDKLMKMNCQSR